MTLSWVPVLRYRSIVMLEVDPLNVVPMGQSYACDPGSILEINVSLSLMVAPGNSNRVTYDAECLSWSCLRCT